MRKDIVNIVNALARENDLNFEAMKTYDIIFKYCKDNKTQPRKNAYKVVNSALYINNSFVGLVKPIINKNMVFSESLDYIENKILSRQEVF